MMNMAKPSNDPKPPAEPTGPVQPDIQFYIEVLQEELKSKEDNRLYLLSVIKQMQSEWANREAEWALERESLSKRIEELQTSSGD